jgi:hypothetical protein
MKTISLARGLTFPAAIIATEVTASLGMRGSGKTNGATLMSEQLLAAGVQVVVLDYVGIHFSLRLQPDGKTSSPYHIPVLGGRHGDIALVPTTGAVIAEALARTHSSAVLDISGFSKGDRIRFATDFAEAFFHAKKEHPGPVQLVLEEAQRFAPQKLFTGMERLLGAFEEIAEVGRNFGIGMHLLSQRPQKINKDVLNLADNVLAYRSNGVLERKAISEWVQEKGAEGRKEVHDELPGLARGTAIVWSPSREIYGKYAIDKRTTYDAGATPIHARAAVKTKPLDLQELEAAVGKAVEESKANDPRVLRARIAELERELAKKPAAKVETVPVPAITEADHKRVAAMADKLRAAEQEFLSRLKEADRSLRSGIDVLAQRQQVVTSEVGSLRDCIWTMVKHPGVPRSPAVNGAHPLPRAVPPPIASDQSLTKCARAILTALAQLGGTTTDSRVSAVSGYRVTSSGFANALSELRTAGLMTGSRGNLQLTDEGARQAGSVPPLPTGKELLDYWLHNGGLGACERALLDCVYANNTISRAALATASGYSATSSGFANAVSKLRTLDLVHGPNGGDLTIAEAFQ